MSPFEHLFYVNGTSSYHNYSQVCLKYLVAGWNHIASQREGGKEAEASSVVIIITVPEVEGQ